MGKRYQYYEKDNGTLFRQQKTDRFLLPEVWRDNKWQIYFELDKFLDAQPISEERAQELDDDYSEE
jgi:hypothetical protein